MSLYRQLLAQRQRLDCEIRSVRVIAVNRELAYRQLQKVPQTGTIKALYADLQGQLGKGIPNEEVVNDLLDLLETHLGL